MKGLFFHEGERGRLGCPGRHPADWIKRHALLQRFKIFLALMCSTRRRTQHARRVRSPYLKFVLSQIIIFGALIVSPCAETNFVSQALPEKLPAFTAVEPKDAEKTFKTLHGFQMQLIAAEPLVTDPVAMVYDENGLGYVVEMNDYPYTDKRTHEALKENTTDKPIGKIRVIEDTNDDGKFDKSYIFAEGLSWPSGICCWKGGVYVTATPDIWYLKDTDGDHKADIRKKVFTGFRKYNVQAVMNNPIWGLDNKIYIAGSSNGGKVVSGENPSAPISVSHNDFRIDPVTEKFEAISGGARFGNTFDDWGNRFLCNIRNPAQQVVLENRYLKRNPYLAVPSAIYDSREPGDNLPVFRVSPPEPWRDIRAKRWVGENKKVPRSELIGAGVFTSSSGITVYRGAAYPKEFHGNAFVCEVANNLVQRQTLVSEGVTFKAETADKKAEFIASTDTWFRPVNFVNAPDGTLHVLDMYRETIEHPWSIPDDIREKLDLESGRDRGRIYRLAPPNFKIPKSPRLGSASTAELIAALENPNSWWRETAQRLLFERQDKNAIAPLQKLVRESKVPLARLHALWTLEGLSAANEEDILRGLSDDAEGVRENAIRIAELHLKDFPKLSGKIMALADDGDMRVRFQTAFTLGEINGPRATAALFAIGQRNPENQWIRTAVLSASPDTCVALAIATLREGYFAASKDGNAWLRQSMFILGAQNNVENIYKTFNAYAVVQYCYCDIDDSFFGGLGEGLRQAGKNLRDAFPTNSIAAKKIDFVLGSAHQMARQSFEPVGKRRAALQLLGYESFEKAKELAQLLNPQEPQELQLATVRVLSNFKNPEVASILIKPWRSYTPAIRDEVLTALLGRKERLKSLFDAIETGEIPVAQIGLARRAPLLSNPDPVVRERAAKLFSQNISSSRKEVIEKYKTNLQGDKTRGEKVFENNCMVCHRFGNKGTDIGPNLETVRQWDAEKLVMNILDPNSEVAPGFVAYEIELKDGAQISGVIATETANSITLKRANSPEAIILRQNIEKISSSGLSLMPDGLEAAISPQDMADLVAFLFAKN